uniref:Ig-like domain-containing protein n=1 Tax=Gadus morhua TaxID=8049 RepID=A0A8C5BET8_GADMO
TSGLCSPSSQPLFFLFIGSSLCLGEAHTMRALVGDNVILSVDTQTSSDIGEAIVEWSRKDLAPDIVHLHENRRTIFEHQNPAYRGRTMLSAEDLEMGIISLKLPNVRQADEGNYTCLFKSKENKGVAKIKKLKQQERLLWFRGEAHTIRALVGDDVTLSVDTETSSDIGDDLIYWYRKDLDPDVVLLQENGRTAYEYQNLAYRDRTMLSAEDLVRGIISLKLFHVRLADEGKYNCFVRSRENAYSFQMSLLLCAVCVSLIHGWDKYRDQIPCKCEHGKKADCNSIGPCGTA